MACSSKAAAAAAGAAAAVAALSPAAGSGMLVSLSSLLSGSAPPGGSGISVGSLGFGSTFLSSTSVFTRAGVSLRLLRILRGRDILLDDLEL